MSEEVVRRGRSARETTFRTIGMLGIVWAAAALISTPITGATFLDLPLGAYLAGQGALIGLVMLGVRVARDD